MSNTEPFDFAPTLRAAPAALSVSELVARARRAVEQALPLSWVRGEISGFKRAASGHAYFLLKDESAQVACVLYRQKSARVPVTLRDGMAIEARVLATFYAPRGEFQLQVEEVRLAGVGALYEAYARLKAALEAEGLFDADRKRALPAFPKRVGLITSRSGAVLHDLVTTLRNRWPAIEIILYPSAVQGADAPQSLLRALNSANARAEVDVLVIGRGGGSMEDLWAFNDEALARAISDSQLPIVSAVGHETDFTIADFVADARAPTPTYAATMIVPDAYEWKQRLDGAYEVMRSNMRFSLRTDGLELARLRAQLKHPRERLAAQRTRVTQLQARLQRAMPMQSAAETLQMLSHRFRRARPHLAETRQYLRRSFGQFQRELHYQFTQKRADLAHIATGLQHLAPQRVLQRGYAVIHGNDGKVVSSIGALTRGEGIRLTLADGQALGTIEDITPNSTQPAP